MISIIVLLPEEKITTTLEELKIAMKEQIGTKIYVRYQIIYTLLSGESYEKIGAYTGLFHATLFNYCKAYCAKGIAGLGRKTLRSASRREINRYIGLRDK